MTNLLILLSAMLSALIGVGPIAGARQAPVAVASVAQEQAVAVPARNVASRPLATLPGIAALIALGMITMLRLPPAIPAWTLRRRE